MIIDILDRYWAKVKRNGPDECWPWTGSRVGNGYGQLANGSVHNNKRQRSLATHIALAIDGRRKPTPDHVAMHSCDNPRCVNPAHLSWGTKADNMADMWAKERSYHQRRINGAMDQAALNLQMNPRNTKLTEADVRYIRASDKTTIALAAELGVTNQCVSNVLTRRTWRHLE